MSVYTRVEHHELEEFLRHYRLGELVEYSGISAGIENTNYFVTTREGRFVLTLFEALSAQELPYFLDLMAHLAEHDVPSAHPKPDDKGLYLRHLNGKPAALVMRLSGHSVKTPTLAQCEALGKALGHLHVVGQEFKPRRANQRGLQWWHTTAGQMLAKLDSDEAALLQSELAFQQQHKHDALPHGVIHADLFRDNALFEDDVLTGIIDFYYACDEVLLYDVAITVNDWCSATNGTLDAERLGALLHGYQTERGFTQAESTAWPVMLRAAALRFWLSRLKDQHFPREGELTHIHDPQVFLRILKTHSNGQVLLPLSVTPSCG